MYLFENSKVLQFHQTKDNHQGMAKLLNQIVAKIILNQMISNSTRMFISHDFISFFLSSQSQSSLLSQETKSKFQTPNFKIRGKWPRQIIVLPNS